MKKKRFTVTSALLYANGPIHLGHVSGAYLPADIFVRYHKLKENDVVFISGSDEHGAAITLQAKKEGVSPKEIIDKYDALNKKTFADFGIDFSIYHRTSSDLHHKTSQEFFHDTQRSIFHSGGIPLSAHSCPKDMEFRYKETQTTWVLTRTHQS